MSHRTIHKGSLPVRSSVATSEAISISGDFVGVGEAIVTPTTLLISFTCIDLAAGTVRGTKADNSPNWKETTRIAMTFKCEIISDVPLGQLSTVL